VKCFNPAVKDPDKLYQAPSAGILDSPNQAGVNPAWSSFIVGALLELADPEFWVGDENQQHAAAQEVEKYLALFTGVAVTPAANMEVAIVADMKPSGISGGAFASGSWQTRELNTVLSSQPWLTLANNTITLAAGNYKIDWRAGAYLTGKHKTRLLSGMLYFVGSTENGASYPLMTSSSGSATMELAYSGDVVLQHYCTAGNSQGFGLASGIADELYTLVTITRLS